jgi:alginate export protein
MVHNENAKRHFSAAIAACAVLTIAGAAHAQATKKCPSGPIYSLPRYNDDFTYLREQRCHGDFWDRIKYIPIDRGADWYLSLGGEIRELYERFHNPLWGQQPQSADGYALQRYMLHADLHLGEDLRIYGELMGDLENGRAGGPRPQIDRDPLDLAELFLDLTIRPLGPDYPITIRAGRQWLIYGSQRLISNRYGPNVPLAFDGVRTILYAKPWQIDAFLVKPVETNTGVFDDKSQLSSTFWGIYAVRPLPIIDGLNIDLYYLGLHRKHAAFAQEEGIEDRETFGTRLWGNRGSWDYNNELIGQTGKFHSGYILAWSVATDTGYTAASPPFRPRIAVRAGIASGDRDDKGPNLQTFNPLFPIGFYFSQAILNGPLNVASLQPNATFHLFEGATFNATWAWFWRQSVSDGMYGLASNLLKPVGTTRDRYEGNQANITFDWQLDNHTLFQVNYLHFFVGGYLRDTPPAGKDVDFVTTSVTYQF